MDDQTSFCWIRVVGVTDLTVSPRSTQEASPSNYHGGRPPKVRSATALGGSVLWFGDVEYPGTAGGTVLIDYGPAFGSRAEAIDWIGTELGLQWAREALNYQLMRVEAASLGGRRNWATLRHGSFPLKDWLPAFYEYRNFKPEANLVPVAELRLAPPDDRPEALQQEFDQLLALMASRQANLQDIVRQAQSEVHALQPVFEAAGIDFDRLPLSSRARAAWRAVQDEAWRATFHFKWKFNRARPWNHPQHDLLKPMFARPDRLYPGHASYPAGHAVMATLWAELLGRVFTDRADSLNRAARRVGELREVAGIHYGSDTRAGADLGRQLAERLWARQERLIALGWDDLVALQRKGKAP